MVIISAKNIHIKEKKVAKMEEILEKDLGIDNQSVFNTARAKAVRILSRFERSDSYIDKLVEKELRYNNLNQMDKALLTELVNGVIRWKLKLDWALVGFYIGDYLKCLNVVKNAMRVGLYQIMFLDKIPPPVAINESVEIVKKIQGEKTAGIVNGVLRNILRNMDAIRYPNKSGELAYYFSIIYSHPKWMVKRWIRFFGEEETEKLLIENNKRPYIPLRVNTLNKKTEDIIKQLEEEEFNYQLSSYHENSILLSNIRMNISQADNFKNGSVTVQDPSASLAVRLASPKPGNNVLDLCSAPGGKAFYMAELMKNQGRIIAVDKYIIKLNHIIEGAERLGFNIIETLQEDALNVDFKEQFDLVFLDVPCSGLGTLSKKPDIKWKREVEDIFNIAKSQRRILENGAKHVKPGGVLLYSTCTIEPEENEENIKWFLEKNKDFRLDRAENYISEHVCKDGFMKTYPHIHGIDGAFAARLIKQ